MIIFIYSIELGIGLIELGIGLIELGIGLIELGIGLRINNAGASCIRPCFYLHHPAVESERHRRVRIFAQFKPNR